MTRCTVTHNNVAPPGSHVGALITRLVPYHSFHVTEYHSKDWVPVDDLKVTRQPFLAAILVPYHEVKSQELI